VEDLRTARMSLRPWAESDLGLLRRLSSEPEVVRYVGDGRLWTAERAASTSDWMVKHWRLHGFGWWTMRLDGTEETIGFAALNHPAEGTELDPSEFEIGWWLDPGYWRRGLAGEAATAVRDDAFGRLRAPSVVARLQPANLGSAAVARHIGLVHERDAIGPWGEPLSIYRGWASNR
jgi:RimJ/RimL family protein N-acetyltransferase